MTVDRPFIFGVAGLVAAAVCVSSSLWKKHRLPEFGRVAACFIAGPGLVSACWLIRQGLIPSEAVKLLVDVEDARCVLILGGLAAAWASVATITKECRSASS
jgi:hypothetical protein